LKYKSCKICNNLVDYDEIFICPTCKQKYCKKCSESQNNICYLCYSQILHKEIWLFYSFHINFGYMKNFKKYLSQNCLYLANILLVPLIFLLNTTNQKFYLDNVLEGNFFYNFYDNLSFQSTYLTICTILSILVLLILVCYLTLLILNLVDHYKLIKFRKYYNILTLILA